MKSRTDQALEGRAAWKLVGVSAPLLAGTALLLILYNNTYQGFLILTLLMCLNVSVLLLPTGEGRRKALLGAAKATAGCMIGGLLTIFAVEAGFTVLMPKDCAAVKDLARGKDDPNTAHNAHFGVVFQNGDQKRWLPAVARTDDRGSFQVWNVPGKEAEYFGYDPNDGFRYVNIIRWNAHGYYDHDYAYEKPPGVYRIVIIGDSYVEAAQVPLARSFHKLLERSLNVQAAVSAGTRPRFQVIALGDSGTGQERHLETLRSEAIKYSPDAVVAALYMNDFCDDSPALRTERTLAQGEITKEFRGLVRHGYLALAFALHRFNEIRRNHIRISPELLQWADPDVERIEAGRRRSFNAILKAREFCRRRGIAFALVYLGSDLELKYALDPEGTVNALNRMHGGLVDFRWDPEKTVRKVVQFAKDHEIPLIDLLPSLVHAQRLTGKFVFGDHFTMFGHEAAAAALKHAFVGHVLPREWKGLYAGLGPAPKK